MKSLYIATMFFSIILVTASQKEKDQQNEGILSRIGKKIDKAIDTLKGNLHDLITDEPKQIEQLINTHKEGYIISQGHTPTTPTNTTATSASAHTTSTSVHTTSQATQETENKVKGVLKPIQHQYPTPKNNTATNDQASHQMRLNAEREQKLRAQKAAQEKATQEKIRQQIQENLQRERQMQQERTLESERILIR